MNIRPARVRVARGRRNQVLGITEQLGKQPLSDQEAACGSALLAKFTLCRCTQGRGQHRRRMKKLVKNWLHSDVGPV